MPVFSDLLTLEDKKNVGGLRSGLRKERTCVQIAATDGKWLCGKGCDKIQCIFEIFQNSGNHKPRVSIANLGFRNEPQDFSDYGFLRYIYIYILCSVI